MVILNPAASGGAGAGVQSVIERELARRGFPFELRTTDGPGHALALTEAAIQARAGRILAVGGDGTIHEVANGLLTANQPVPALAVVPVGTGNDFFRMLGGPNDPLEALDVLENGAVRTFDVGRVRFGEAEAFFVNLLGVGIDVEVLRRRDRFSGLRGLPQYLAALTSALVTFRPASFRVSFRTGQESRGEEVIEDRTILTAVTVGPSVGGGFLLNPNASPYDGLLDLFFVRPLGILKLARYIPKVIRGTHGSVPELIQETIIGAEIRRSGGEPFFFEMDGECFPEPVTCLELEVCPGTLPVLVPMGAA
jgi:YegS/Rv2252/BmrU family lipid kinase